MPFSKLLLATLVAAVAASPVDVQLTKRADPEDTSGTAQVYFECSSHTYPNPGGPAGGWGISQDILSLHLPDGTVAGPGEDGCEQDSEVGESALLVKCKIYNDQLDNGSITVHVSWSDIGHRCTLNFGYKGYSYEVDNQDEGSITSSCGYSESGFEPFGTSLTDVCYFNA
ncbi:hypothetical protein BJY04DRAFT_98838 [Aspergillus karnatakaensis]|uniref:uncharacterized protein n=1 Tax=Aspergillus karnatakaensis TaxID=1810916 RepID=UPI003CCCCA92